MVARLTGRPRRAVPCAIPLRTHAAYLAAGEQLGPSISHQVCYRFRTAWENAMQKLLLVDDDLIFRAALARRLKPHVTVLVASSVAEAHDALEREAVDIVLADFNLRDGSETGAKLLQQLAESRPTVRRLLMTGTTDRPAAEAEQLFEKPLEISDLLATLAAGRDGRSAADAAVDATSSAGEKAG
jgi:DNA-binding NtrC family response regulator